MKKTMAIFLLVSMLVSAVCGCSISRIYGDSAYFKIETQTFEKTIEQESDIILEDVGNTSWKQHLKEFLLGFPSMFMEWEDLDELMQKYHNDEILLADIPGDWEINEDYGNIACSLEVAFYDIDDDNIPEVFIYSGYPCTCSSWLDIYKFYGNSYEKILNRRGGMGDLELGNGFYYKNIYSNKENKTVVLDIDGYPYGMWDTPSNISFIEIRNGKIVYNDYVDSKGNVYNDIFSLFFDSAAYESDCEIYGYYIDEKKYYDWDKYNEIFDELTPLPEFDCSDVIDSIVEAIASVGESNINIVLQKDDPPEPPISTITIGGIEYSTDLTELVLSGFAYNALYDDFDGIIDLEPLKYMTNLTSLWLEVCDVDNISALESLTNLTDLAILSVNIDDNDISVLKSLTNLTSLLIRYTNIEDMSVLKNLTSLTSLSLDGIGDISVLKSLINLTSLGFRYGSIDDMSVLKNLTNLTSLEFHGCGIHDISALKNLTNLTSLYLFGNEISDISVLKSLVNLEYINLSGNYSINAEQIAELQAALPNCEIKY